MGQLINGVRHDIWYDTKSIGGRFQHSTSVFRNWFIVDGAPGPTGEDGFVAEKDCCHLYVPLVCPWVRRTLTLRKLGGLEPFTSVSVMHPLMLEDGRTLDDNFPVAISDTLYQHELFYQLYLYTDPHYNGQVTILVLRSKESHTIVSNEFVEVIRTFNTAFDAPSIRAGGYHPPALQSRVDELNG